MKKLHTPALLLMTLLAACNGLDCRANSPGSGPGTVPRTTTVPSAVTSHTGSIVPDAGPVGKPKSDRIQWISYEEGVSESKLTEKKLLIFFTTTWCPYCRMMDRDVWTDRELIDIVTEGYVTVRVDTQRNPELKDRHGVNSVPRIIVYDPGKGEELLRISGWFSDVDVYRDALD